MKLEIKICGNKERDNLKEVCSLNPDYVGFVFYNKSQRYVSKPDQIIKLEHCKAKRVGVFVNANEQEIRRTVIEFKLDIAQLHGDETPEFMAKINDFIPVFKAFQINNNFNFNKLSNYLSACNRFLFDTTSTHYGGSGKKFDWNLLDSYKYEVPFILSGGIEENDVDQIMKIKNSMLAGVDLNSKFEIRPGVKDIGKLSSFIKQLKE